MVGGDCDAGAEGNDAREPEGRGAVDAEGFGYYSVEALDRRAR